MFPFVKDVCGRHIIWEKTDLYFGSNELHGHIIIDPVNGDRRILIDPAENPVHEAFIQPGSGLRFFDLRTGIAVPFQRDLPDPRVVGSIIGTDVVCKKAVKLLQRMNSFQIQSVKPGFF
jgi:hypothetical protein